MQKLKKLYLIMFSLLSIFLFKGVAEAATTYKMYEDSNGVRWQYAYIEDSDRVEISFFDNRNSGDSVTLPSLSNLKSNDSTIPTSATKLVVVNYVDKGLGTPTSQTKNITTINLSNANVINGVSPMIKNDIVTTITFSSAVGTSIGTEAFMGYKLTINNLDKVVTIGDRAFKNAELTYKNLNLGNLTTIGDASFQGTNIEKVTMINTERIEYNAFRDCVNLTSVKLGNNVNDIGDAAFQNAQKLTEINYNNVTKVGNFAFADCTSYNVDISTTKLTDIGDAAYSNTPGFTKSIKIPDEVTFLGWRVFYKSGITGVDLNNVERLNSIESRDEYIQKYGSGYQTPGHEGEAFAECANLSEINYGKIWMIPYKTFYNDKKITKVDFPDSVLWIKTEAFENCSINELNLNKIQRIDASAFAGNKLTELYLPKSTNHMSGASGAFMANEITKVTIAYDTMSNKISESLQGTPFINYFTGGAIGSPNYNSGSTDYDKITDLILEAPYKENEEAQIDSLFGSGRLTYNYNGGYSYGGNDDTTYGQATHYKNIIQTGYFWGLNKLKNITIGEGYEFIGAHAFMAKSSDISYPKIDPNLEKLTLPSTLKGIGIGAFEYTIMKETEVKLPEDLEYIGFQAFYASPGFKGEFNLKNLKYVGDRAFSLTGVEDIYLHDKLEYVGREAFYCGDLPNSTNHLKNLSCNTKKIIIDMDLYGLKNASDHRFQGTWSNQNQYDLSDIDNEYDLIKFTNNVITMPTLSSYPSFMWGIRAKEIDMSETPWKTIQASMFVNAHVDEIKLPQNLERIEREAFQGAIIKEPIEIPDTVNYIGQVAFHGAAGYGRSSTAIPVKNIPSSLQYLGHGAFYNVDFTEEIVIPESLTNIGGSYPRTFGSDPSLNLVRESVVINSDIVTALAAGGVKSNPAFTIGELFGGTTVKKITFGENVTKLMTNDSKLLNNSEFYNLGVEEVVFENLKVLPQKAFIDSESLKKVTFKNGLEEIGDFAFYNTSLEEVNLPDDNRTIKVGYSAFRKTNLETIGDDNSGFNILANNIVTTGPYAFADNNNLRTVIVPDGFNNNVIGEYTFKNCDNLNKVDVYRDIKTINSEAFNGDYNFKKLFLWGDTKVEQNNVNEISEAGKIKVINTSAYYREALEADPKAQLKFTIKSINGNVELTKAQIDYGYTYEYDGTGKITFEHPSEVTVNLVKTSDGYIANIEDVKETIDYGDFTVPAATDLYSYSTYDIKKWEADNSDTRRSEELGTDAKFYDLDEVLYLTSNHPKVKLINGKDDFDKKDLIVYALRRDGVIMESAKWGEYTSHYARSSQNINFEKYAATTEEDIKMVYDTPYPAEETDVSTENFKSMRYEIKDSKGILPKKEIELYYTNSMIDTTVDTMIEPTTVVDEIVDKITDTVDTGSGYVISTIVFLILSFLGLRFILLKRKKKLIKI